VPKQPTFLIISQVYVPDPTSVGQHIADAAAEMVKRGYRVRVLTSANGYDDPTKRYPIHEVRDGVEIRRLPFSSFGKRSIPVRVAGQLLFLIQAIWHGIFTPGLAGMMISTSPPMASMAALAIGFFRRVPVKFWAMDLNPDQVIALKKMKEGSLAARVMDGLNRKILQRSSDVVALDRFMAGRLLKKRDVSSKMSIMPPWPHEDELESIEHEVNPFRKAHNLDGKFVVMYSGNHGYSTPVTTVLQAALRLQHREDIVFMFIGGGVGKKEVEATIAEHKPSNIRSLPYQPLSEIRWSLSAADVHVVTIGDAVVGIVHPCKVYGAMAVSRPILLVGPNPCHVSDLIQKHDIGWHIQHGDVEAAVKTIEQIAATPRERLKQMGARAQEVIRTELSKEALCGRFCDVMERGLVNG
jgi:glycosyltransferase involved in cell wall biosynthesis